MLRKGPIPAAVHGIFEYVAGIVFIAAPFIFSFESGVAKAVCVSAGVLVLALAATSALPTGLIDSVPVSAHLVLDLLFAGLLVASPFVFGYSDEGAPTAVSLVLGVAHLLVTIGTRFVAPTAEAAATRE